MKSQTLVFAFVGILFLLSGGQSKNYTKVIKLGLITPPDGKLGFERVAAATTMAMQQARLDGYLLDVDVQFIWRNGNCNGKLALGVTVTMWEKDRVDGYIGLPCSIASINAGKLIAYWNMPHLSYSSVDPILADKVTYNTLVRLISPYNRLASALVELLEYYHWTRVAMVMMRHPDNHCDYAGRAFDLTLQHNNITVGDWINSQEFNPSVADMTQWLKRIQTRGRVVLICGVASAVRTFMMQAQQQGMTTGEYVYISPSLLPVDNLETPWVAMDGYDHEARLAFTPLLQMSLGFIASEESQRFLEEIPYRMAEPPWNYNGTLLSGQKRFLEEIPYRMAEPPCNYNGTLLSGQKGSPFALFLFDTVYMYAMVADKLYKQGSTPLDGTKLFELAKKTTFKGKTGVVMLDDNGDRIGDYRVWHLPQNGGQYEPMVDIIMTNAENQQRMKILRQRYWGDKTQMEAPADAPACGFYNELCPTDTSARDLIIILVAIGLVLVASVLMAGIFIHRRRKFEEELELMLWKIRFDDIEFIGKVGSSRVGSVTLTETSSLSLCPALDNPHVTVRPALYKGATVAVKHFDKSSVMLTRADHVELKAMRDVAHENLNLFVGACIDSPNICAVFKYCSKGSLQDILMTEEIKLDTNFKNSLLIDIVNGMEYLHRSPLKSHGRLKSTNCVVDGRWVLRVTDWGLSAFNTNCELSENTKYQGQFWTSPEQLRELVPTRNGTQKGDVYSFAVILQELLYRALPFQAAGLIDMVPKDIVGRVRNGETPPFRPALPTDEAHLSPAGLLELMRDCWAEEHSVRPDFITIKNRLSTINKGKRYNIMDNMLRMMEKYATNLEELVGDRTRQLSEEKKKTDMLLYRMLPSAIAELLKSGKSIPPVMYPDVSIYFSDIVAFTTLSSESTPLQVVDFLNDLWTLFDDIIMKYNVYKVETIGDAYMVAGGLPAGDNTSNHASEIADMALDILSSVMTFKIRHRPTEQLRVRIGIHSGSVVAGVVGQTMPRYCLFGDTVNVASRMESTGDALRVHISEATYHCLRVIPRGYIMTKRGEIEVKGKGLQTTYWLEGRDDYMRPLPRFTD